MTYRDTFETCQSRQIPKQHAHLRVVVGKIFNASPPAYKQYCVRLPKSKHVGLKFKHIIVGPMPRWSSSFIV